MIVQKTDKVSSLKIHELRCFDAVVKLGSFQAAADALNRTHPSIFSAVGKLEERLGLKLFDRSGYRVELTDDGRMFHARAKVSLFELDNLDRYARQLSGGEEAVLRIVLGDLCPRQLVIPVLSAFFAQHSRTRLHLDYEAVGGPAERLRTGTADLVVHRVDHYDVTVEHIKLRDVALIPVVAPRFLPFDAAETLTPERMQPFTQCVIRDTAQEAPSEQHYLIDGSHRCAVADHAMKKELILNGMAWGHLPDFMIKEEIRTGALTSIQSRHLPGSVEAVAATRRRDRLHGPVAEALWQCLRSAFAH